MENHKVNRKRCTWCGKRINYHLESSRTPKKVTPKFFYFARCSNCGQYYGQAVYSLTYMRIMFYICVPIVIATFVLEIGWLLVIYAFFVTLSLFAIPFSRMDCDENFIENEDVAKYKVIFKGNNKVKKGNLYFVSNEFDECESFSIASPMCIDFFDAKKNEVTFHFLYDHFENEKVMKRNIIQIYDSNMKPFGEFETIV